MSTHSKAAAKFIADADRTAWHDKALYAVREKRDKMARTVPEWEDLRRMSSEIKRHTLSHLGHYLEEFERNATANGMAVHWAADADEMNATVWRLVQEHGGRNLVKSKSMLSEECGLTPYLRERGVDAVESDLGERIMQLLELPPSHIVLPAIGVRREEVGELFEREFGTEHGNSDPTYLTHEARRQLRPKFLGADIAMTGVNFAVASTGTLAVCTNEGNADMGTSFPDLHIAIMGLEKVIPDMRALAVFTRLLARSGTGQPVTSYTSLYRKPAPGKRIHVVIVDNGRSEWLADAAHRNMLKCLRCGACMNTCPVYRRSGGYSYSYFIAGHQPVDAAFAEAPPRQCLGLLAVLLLLGRMPGDDRPRGTDLRMAAGVGAHASGRPGKETDGQRHGLHHGRATTILRRHRAGPRRGASPARRAQQPVQSVERPGPRHAAVRPQDVQCPVEAGRGKIRKNE